MLIRATSYSPETLVRLQRIFDAVWREVERQKGKGTFPWDIEATRFTIARLVLEHGRDQRNPAQIKREVLRGLEQIGDSNRQIHKGALPATEARVEIDAKEVRALRTSDPG